MLFRSEPERLLQILALITDGANALTLSQTPPAALVIWIGGALVATIDPHLLSQIYDPPLVLYVKGTLTERDRNGVAIVGSRQVTSYGMETARKLAYQLAYVGVTVVSGGARGIDTAAHQGALSAKGRTIAVLGTGINLVFPAENAELFERIAASGAVKIGRAHV